MNTQFILRIKEYESLLDKKMKITSRNSKILWTLSALATLSIALEVALFTGVAFVTTVSVLAYRKVQLDLIKIFIINYFKELSNNEDLQNIDIPLEIKMSLKTAAPLWIGERFKDLKRLNYDKENRKYLIPAFKAVSKYRENIALR